MITITFEEGKRLSFNASEDTIQRFVKVMINKSKIVLFSFDKEKKERVMINKDKVIFIDIN